MGPQGQTLPAVRAALVAAAVLAATATAQQPPPKDEPSRPVLIDRVIATVGDAAILQSKMLETAQGEIHDLEQERGRALTPEERQRPLARAMQRLVHDRILAQGAKTLGIVPPSRVEEIVRDRLAEAEQTQVRQLGGLQKFSEELLSQNRTYPAWEREQRIEIESSLAEDISVWSRLQNQRNLFITPRMLREAYQLHRDDFVYGPRASLAVVAFDAAAADKAAAAVKKWREMELTAAEVATEFGGLAVDSRLIRGLDHITEASSKDLDPLFVRFALDHPAGTVSDPQPSNRRLYVLRVLEQVPGADGRFEDPAVQNRLRKRLEEEVVAMLKLQALRRSQERTYVWLPGAQR